MGLILALAGRLIGLTAGLRGAMGALAGWIAGPVTHRLIAGQVAALLLAVWASAGWHRAAAETRAARADQANWQRAAMTMRTSYDALAAASAAQNAAVARLKTASDTRAALAEKALAAAGHDAIRMRGLAGAIDADTPPSAPAGCSTSPAVLAARGEL